MGELILVGDRVLIDPDEASMKTRAGLVLPASVTEKERVQGGKVVKTGPGYGIPNPEYSNVEPWERPKAPVNYIPLQAREGDTAFFLRKEAIELTYEEKKYLIIPHYAILALIREQPDERTLYHRD